MTAQSWIQNEITKRLGMLGKSLGFKPPRPLFATSNAQASKDTTAIDVVLGKLRTMQREFEQATAKLGFIGESGSGKSSLINAMVGRPVAPVGALIETTQRPQEVPVDGITLVDLPGCGTASWPKETYIDQLRLLESYDAFVLVTAHRLKQCDTMLFEELSRKAGKPFFVVRSHFDQAAAAHDPADARCIIEAHIRQQLKSDTDLPVYMISSVGENHFDLERLILDIRAVLPEWKQVRFIMAAKAYGQETLALKRTAAQKIVGIYAGLAAANSLNPVPGLDVSVDLGILTTMAHHVISTYGFDPEQVEALKRQVSSRAATFKGFQEVADRLAPYLTRKFIMTGLERMGLKVAVRNSAKWLPIAGTLISAGLGYKLTYAFGEKLIEDCEAAAQDWAELAMKEHISL